MKKRVRTTAFWVGLASAVTIMIENFANIFGFSVRTSLIEEFILSICGVLVVLGFVVKDKEDGSETKQNEKQNDKDNNLEDVNNVNCGVDIADVNFDIEVITLDDAQDANNDDTYDDGEKK